MIVRLDLWYIFIKIKMYIKNYEYLIFVRLSSKCIFISIYKIDFYI